MQDLTLYFMPTCPFCRRVLDFMEEKNISIDSRDINTNADYRQALLSIGGKTQVPCLVIDGEALYESDDIIQWLKDNL